ncbi:MAG: trans-sulfuration enzyme family protein [Anaerolineales bacterium]|jgi:methionine-gamma-lyase
MEAKLPGAPAPRRLGLGTLVTHLGEYQNPYYAHVMPIYQSAAFCFPDVETGAQTFGGEVPGYIYSRLGNPNFDLLAQKLAALETLDLIGNPAVEQAVGLIFSSGMAAISAALLACAQSGDTVIVQKAVYGNTYLVLENILSRLGLQVAWVEKPSPAAWQAAFEAHPGAVLAFAESPVNPAMAVVDLQAVAEIAHRYHARLLVDNTFATPFCQRPLALGADIVLHSTTKYLTGHGAVVGGAAVGLDAALMREKVAYNLKYLGAVPSPFDTWLTNLGLKTFEVRMERHCTNALQVAHYLEGHSAVARVFYPGLASHPEHAIARRQMSCYGGMLAFELKGGLKAGAAMMDRVRVATLAVSLGNVDTLIQHPASMTHSSVPAAERQAMGISDGLVRLSVGIENVEDLIADLDQAMAGSAA